MRRRQILSDKDIENLSYEEAINELEKIVKQLEQGNLSLEQSLDSFQRGIKLGQYCKEKLKSAEETVTKIVKEDGSVEDFEEQDLEDK